MGNASESPNMHELPDETDAASTSKDQIPRKKRESGLFPGFGFLNPFQNQIEVVIDGQTYYAQCSNLTWTLGILFTIMLLMGPLLVPVGYPVTHPYVLISIALFVIAGFGRYLSYGYDRRRLKKEIQSHKSK